jgi:hypothetical protein
MKLWLFIILTFATLIACSKDTKNTNDSKTLPDCIQNKIDEILPLSSIQLLGVYKYKIDGQYHYWFHTDMFVSDFKEYIYNEDCEEMCGYCGACIKPKCIDVYPDYGSSEWEVAWKP